MDITTVIVAVVVFVLALVFRGEIRQLISWFVGFRRITKTADGYALEPGGEPLNVQRPAPADEVKAKTSDPEAIPAAAAEDDEEAYKWIELAAQKQYSEAVDLLDRQISAAQDIKEATRLRSYKAQVLFDQNPAEGNRYFEELVRSHPSDEEVHYWRGLAFYFVELYSEAIEAFDYGLRTLPNSHRLISAKAEALADQGQSAPAMTVLRDALERGVHHPSLYSLLAKIMEQQEGDPSEVEAVLNAGIRENPKAEGVRAKYASFLWERGRNEEAIIQYLELIAIDPADPSYWSMVGNAYFNLELFDLALKAYERAEKESKRPQAWIIANIGNLYNGRGLYSKAVEYLRRAVELEPDSEYALDRLAKAVAAQAKESKAAEDAAREGRGRLAAAPGVSRAREALPAAEDP